MSEVKRFMAPGPWVTRELRECVQASDYDDLRGQLGDSRESYIRVKEAAAHSQRRAEEAESKLAAATRERDEATARLNAIIPSCEDWEARERDAERWRFIQSRAWVQMGAGYCEYSTFEASEKNRAFRGSEIDAAIEQRRAAASAGGSQP